MSDAPLPKLHIATANDLIKGDVVFLNDAGDWTNDLAMAAVADTSSIAQDLLLRAEGQTDKIVGAYLVEVARTSEGRLEAVHYRERIRLAGPTTRLDLGRQAERS